MGVGVYGVFRGVLGVILWCYMVYIHVYMYKRVYIGVNMVMQVYKGCIKGII